MSKQNQWIAGINAVSAALQNDAEHVREVLLEAGSKNPRIQEIESQARRLDIRGRFEDGTKPLATLNGTLCAMTRTIVAILETHQQADGSVRVPQALQPFMGGLDVLEPVGA